MSCASKQANGRASGPVLQSVFLVDLAHSARHECATQSKLLLLFKTFIPKLEITSSKFVPYIYWGKNERKFVKTK